MTWNQIVTAYVDITLPKELRQSALKETYNFICKCSLCANTGPTDPRISMRCPKSCGSTCLLPTEGAYLSRIETLSRPDEHRLRE